MKLVSIIILFFLSLFSCTKKNSREEDNQLTVAASAAQVEKLNTKKNIAVIYHSIDGGLSWTPYDNGIPGDATVSAFLIIDDKIFASTDYNGIYSIREGQKEWKRVDENLPDGIDINAIATINNILIIGTLNHGVMLSKDNGKTWQYPVNQIKPPVRCFHAKGNFLFAGTDNGIYRSLDYGNSWEHTWGRVQVNGFTEINNNAFAALMNGAATTNDNGKNWRYVYEPHTLHDISTDGRRIYAMTLGDGLKRSENEGLSWETANFGLGTLNLYTFEVKQFGGKLFAAQWYGIYMSDNWGTNWTLIKNGLPDSTAFSTLETTKNGLIAGIGLRKKE